MPFVNIYLQESTDQETRDEISSAVHESLRKHFNVPEDDYFQVIQGLQEGDLKFPASYLGVTHTDRLVYVYITCNTGRTQDMKKALYASITRLVSERTSIAANDVIIILNETLPENWSFGQGIAQYI